MSDFEKFLAAHFIVTEAQRPFGRFTMFMLKVLLAVVVVGLIGLLAGS